MQPVPLLSATDLDYEYYGSPALTAINLQLGLGELVALVGRNGAGKSTLLRCLAGWARPVKGEIRILGLPVYEAERAVRCHVILVPDTPTFYDELTAWEHLQFSAQAHRLAGWEEKAAGLLDRFGLWPNRRNYPFIFSRGMRYKLAICLGLLLEPELLLLDEPLGPLDPLAADQLWAELVRLRGAGMGILLSSHQLPPQPRPDRYLILEQGRLIAQGSPAELEALSAAGNLGALLRAAIGLQGAGQDAV